LEYEDHRKRMVMVFGIRGPPEEDGRGFWKMKITGRGWWWFLEDEDHRKRMVMVFGR
jgi:hypothetical protein